MTAGAGCRRKRRLQRAFQSGGDVGCGCAADGSCIVTVVYLQLCVTLHLHPHLQLPEVSKGALDVSIFSTIMVESAGASLSVTWDAGWDRLEWRRRLGECIGCPTSKLAKSHHLSQAAHTIPAKPGTRSPLLHLNLEDPALKVKQGFGLMVPS